MAALPLLMYCMNDEPYLEGLDGVGCLIGCWVDTWQVESSCRALHLQFLLLTGNNQKLVVHIESFPIACLFCCQFPRLICVSKLLLCEKILVFEKLSYITSFKLGLVRELKQI